MSTKLKTYKAATMPQVLAKIKQDLGSDAVIVNTRSLREGGMFGFGQKTVVEVTARKSQKEDTPKRPMPGNSSNRLKRLYAQPSETMVPAEKTSNHRMSEFLSQAIASQQAASGQGELKNEISEIKQLVENLVKEQRQVHSPNMPEQLFDFYLNLIQKEVADELAREIIDSVQKDLTGNQMKSSHVVEQRLADTLENMIDTTGPVTPNINGTPRTVALIGPTGVGKTTTIAKLAAHFKLKQNKNVGLITIDTYRIGAVDQLRMYAQIIDVPLKVVLTPEELKEAISLMSDLDMIFIDTAGRSQNDDIKIKELQSFLQAANADEVHLVLSTTGHHTTMINVAEKFSKVGIDRVIFTKLDEAISFGVIFSVLQKVDASLSYITTGQDVPADIEVGNGRKLAQLLLSNNHHAILSDSKNPEESTV